MSWKQVTNERGEISVEDYCDVCGGRFEWSMGGNMWFYIDKSHNPTWDICNECKPALPKVLKDANKHYHKSHEGES